VGPPDRVRNELYIGLAAVTKDDEQKEAGWRYSTGLLVVRHDV